MAKPSLASHVMANLDKSECQSGQPKAPLVSILKDHHLLRKKPSEPAKETSGASVQAPVTRANTVEPGAHKLGPKMDKCVKDLKKKAGNADPYAVCTVSVGQKNSKKESKKINFRGKLMEMGDDQGMQGKRFRVTLLREGLGNMKDCFYYTKDALISAATIYEGKKFFIDHPSETEEMDLPERSVNDIAGYFENMSAVPDSDGVTNLMGDLVMIPGPSFDRYRSLMAESIAYSQKHPDDDLVGLSINAEGDFDTMAIDQFLKQIVIPNPCKQKILEAMDKGITMIRPVSQMTSAFSCDLVTTAGAGGKVNQMLEQEKKNMAKAHEDEGSKEYEKKESEDGMGGAAGASADGDGDHADADQDEQLIKKMMNKYLGEPDHGEEAYQMAKQAHEAAKAMGMEGEEAMKCAGYNLKMAHHMQKQAKSAPADGAPAQESDPDQPEQKVGGGAKAVGGPGSVPGKDVHHEAKQEEDEAKQKQKESARKGDKMVEMAAEVARLRQQLDAIELEKHIDKSLKEAKLPNTATKKFRECIKGVRTQKEVSDKLAIFKEAFGLGGMSETVGWIYGTEKQGSIEDTGMGFGDCVEND